MQSLGSKKSSRFHRELLERSCKYLSCSSVIHIHPPPRIPDQNMTHSCSNYVDDGSTVFTKDGKLVVKVSSACPDGTCLNSGWAPRKHIMSPHVTPYHTQKWRKERGFWEAREVFSWRNNYVCWCEFSFLCLPILVVQLRTCHEQGRIHLRLPGQLWRLVEGLTDRVWRSWDIMTQCGTTCEDCRGNVFRGNVCGTL